MKYLFLSIFLSLSVCAFAQIEKIIPSKPNPPRLVNDYTRTLTEEQRQYLENKLVAYDDTTSNQVAIVIIPTLDGNSLEDAGLKILRDWGIGGQAGSDNGILILIVKNDRKVRIEVGYGLEGAVSDLTASSIIENEITPNFREGNYYRGLDAAVDAIIKAAHGKYTAPANYSKKKDKGISIGKIIFLLIIIWILLGMFSSGSRGGMASRRGYRGTGPIWWWPTSGGWSGGGGGWSGGGGGGGFGGFGGGSGGGGGASGSW